MKNSSIGRLVMIAGALVFACWVYLYYTAASDGPDGNGVGIPLILIGGMLATGTILSTLGYYLRHQKLPWVLLVLVAPFLYFFLTDAFPHDQSLLLVAFYFLGPLLILVSGIAYIYVGKDK